MLPTCFGPEEEEKNKKKTKKATQASDFLQFLTQIQWGRDRDRVSRDHRKVSQPTAVSVTGFVVRSTYVCVLTIVPARLYVCVCASVRNVSLVEKSLQVIRHTVRKHTRTFLPADFLAAFINSH